MSNAKLMSRWVGRLAWALMLFIPLAIVSFLSGYPEVGLAFVLLAPVFMLTTMGLALYSLLSARCSECGQRFFSVTYPVWPFESTCAGCGTHARNVS